MIGLRKRQYARALSPRGTSKGGIVLGARHQRQLTADQKKLKQAEQDLLDTKEVAANLAADSIAKDATILDLKEAMANLIISTGGAV